MRQGHTNIHHACIILYIYKIICIHVHAYSACANTTPIFLRVKHAFPRVAGICWTRIIEWECQGRTRISFFPSFIQSLCGLHWITTDVPFQLRMVAQDYPWLSTKRGTQASELPASGPCQVQAGLPATALLLLRPGGCKCFDFSSTKGLRAYLQKRKASHSATSMLIF
jgi:hypothetical protein